MKEVLNFNQDPKIEIQAEQQQKKDIRLLGQEMRIKGLTLWQFNTISKVLIKAKFEKIHVVDFTNQVRENHKVKVQDNCIYFQALNLKTAIKKLNKNGIKTNIQ